MLQQTENITWEVAPPLFTEQEKSEFQGKAYIKFTHALITGAINDLRSRNRNSVEESAAWLWQTGLGLAELSDYPVLNEKIEIMIINNLERVQDMKVRERDL